MPLSISAIGFLSLGLLTCVALAVSDLRRFVLPNSFVAALALCGFGFHYAVEWRLLTPVDSLIGAAAGFGGLYLFKIFYERLRGIQALGLGDVKFMAAAGVWVGAQALPLLLLIASLSTLVCVIGLHVYGRTGAGKLISMRLPFGPGLCTALPLTLLELVLRSSAY